MTSRAKPSVVWFRNDLRVHDHYPLKRAVEAGGPVIPLFILCPESYSYYPGSASRWWLHHSLSALAEKLRALKSKLILRSGDPKKELARLVRETGAGAVYGEREGGISGNAFDEDLAVLLRRHGADLVWADHGQLFDPESVRTGQGTIFKVFTPFYRCLQSMPPPGVPRCLRVSRLNSPVTWPKSEKLGGWKLLPEFPWDKGLRKSWRPGPDGARQALRSFLKSALLGYADHRDDPSVRGTSRLSPHLHFGEISVREVWHEVRGWLSRQTPRDRRHGESYLRQLIWRDFAHYLLRYFPKMGIHPLRKEFSGFRWRRDDVKFRAWCRGRTGYPIVDAGMRELRRTGWMHNRVRMIAASFLVKDLLMDWRDGAKWFMDTLVDADLANNAFGWQWVAGCGADSAPYFRIFNPILQGEKFDSEGAYVRKWIPELSKLSKRWIHKPWLAPSEILLAAGIELGKDYPRPVVDHDFARKRALISYHQGVSSRNLNA